MYLYFVLRGNKVKNNWLRQKRKSSFACNLIDDRGVGIRVVC
jgi:hypothetical protein